MEQQFDKGTPRNGRYRLLMGALALMSLYFFISGWRTALHEGYYYPKASFIFPALLIFGIHECLFPDLHHKVKDAGARNWRDMPKRYRILIGLALAAGLINAIAISNAAG